MSGKSGFTRTAVSMVALAALALGSACSQAEDAAAPVEEAANAPVQHADTAVAEEAIDPFTLIIDTERWGVLMDYASSGALSLAMTGEQEERSDLYRLDHALRSGARQLLALRDSLCVDGVSPERTCQPIDLPDWVVQPPGDVEAVSLTEYQTRSDWLGAASSEFVEVGCEAGRSASGDHMFCSVE